MVENSFNKKINSIRVDKGGEYIKGDFQNLCELEGIQMEHSVPYTPQQNGVAERKNMSLKEMATCLLHAKHLPPYPWVEAINYDSYFHNRVPHKSVVGATPFEALHGHKPISLILDFLVPNLGLEYHFTRGRPSRPKVVNSFCWDMQNM